MEDSYFTFLLNVPIYFLSFSRVIFLKWLFLSFNLLSLLNSAEPNSIPVFYFALCTIVFSGVITLLIVLSLS